MIVDGKKSPKEETQERIKKQLLKRASEYATDACRELTNNCEYRFYTNAAFSLELLGKAILSHLSPVLIMQDDFDSILYALGLESYSNLIPIQQRTISGRKVLERCKQVLSKRGKTKGRLTSDVKKNLEELIDIRNGTLHLAVDVPEKTSELASSFYSFLEIASEFLNIKIDEIIKDSDYILLLEREKSKSEDLTAKRVNRKILAAKKFFDERCKDLSEEGKEAFAKLIEPHRIIYDDETSTQEYWKCPACGLEGKLDCMKEIGDPIYDKEHITTGILKFEISLEVSSFKCPFCGLRLEEEELEAAGLPLYISGEPEAGYYADEYSDEVRLWDPYELEQLMKEEEQWRKPSPPPIDKQ